MEFWYLTFGPRLRMRLIEVYLLDILSLQSFPCFDFWKSPRKVTFNLHQKQHWSHLINMGYPHDKYLYEIHHCYHFFEMSCTQVIFMVSTVWPLVTKTDLWPKLKIIWIIYSIWSIQLPIMRPLELYFLEIKCLQAILWFLTVWPLVIPNDLWSTSQTIGIIF